MSQPTIKTSFASGEWAPKLRSRVDIAKYHTGATLLRNFYIDYSGGGASTRQGTEYINTVGANGARLIPFQPSTTLSYVLEFGQNYIRFYSNGLTILSGGLPYQITSPYNIADLFPNPFTGNPGLKFVQNVTSLIITHPNYPPQILTVISPTNWTLTAISFNPTIATPSGLGLISNLGAGTFNYGYLVTAVDINGQESAPSIPALLNSKTDLRINAGTNTLTWAAVTGAVSYNVYKTEPTVTVAIAAGAQYGFVGNVTGLTFNDTEPGAVIDFSQTPPVLQNPFAGGSIVSLNLVTNANYTTVPTITIPTPAGGVAATGYVSLGVSVAVINHALDNFDIITGSSTNPQGSVLNFANNLVLTMTSVTFVSTSGGVYRWKINTVSITSPGSVTSGSVPTNPVQPTSTNYVGGVSKLGGFIVGATYTLTWDIGSLVLVSGGEGYTVAPVPTFSAGAATATTTLGPLSSGNPGVPGFFQERLVLAGQPQAIQSFNMSQPGSFFNFNVSNPAQDDDAISGTIISEELNDIRNLIPTPTGLAAFTGHAAWLINGGGGISTANPITPSNVTASSQAFNGANDLKPIKISLDVLYGTNKGNYVRDLAFNIYANIYTGSDISVLSNHLFFGYYMLDWAWSEEPFKTLWCVRDDGVLLSLGYVKEQDLIGWAHHDTNGQFLSVCSVIENVNGNIVDAVYVIVQRVVNGATVQYVERMADRYFPYGYEDAWSVDCGLQTAPQVSPTGTLSVTGAANAIGNVVTLTDTADAPFTGGMVGWVVRAGGGIYTISAFTSTSVVTATVTRVSPFINQYTGVAFPVITGYAIWEPVTLISGLTQLEGQTVTGVADGVVVPPTVVSNTGTVTLSTSASKVTLGLSYLPQMQTLPLDLGEPTVQGKRKKIVALTLRVADTLGLQAGTIFANVVQIKDFILGNIPTTSTGPALVTDLVDGDGRIIIDQAWQEAGSYCIQQNLPYPATILGVMPEVIVGDSK